MADAKICMTKLNNENYFVWKYKMQLLLKKEKVWHIINEEKQEPLTEIWKADNSTAMALIGLSVEDSQLGHIRSETSARNQWINLQNYYEKSTLSNKVYLMRKICKLNLEEGGDANTHVNEMVELFQKLRDLGDDQLTDGWCVAMLLSSLPKSFDTLITALETRPEVELTFGLVQSKVISEYNRRCSADICSKESVLRTLGSSSSNNKERVCYFCKKNGHFKQDCLKYKKWKSSSPQRRDKSNKFENKVKMTNESEEFLFITYNDKDKQGWIVDSGATCHITSDRSFFVDLDSTHCEKINVANGNKVFAKGKGSGKIKFLNERNEESSAMIKDVLYVPEIEGNLLSVKKLIDKGFLVDFNKDRCEIKYGERQIAVADSHSNLYMLRQSNPKAYCTSEQKVDCIHDWHRRCGHRDVEAIKLMCSSGLVKDMLLSNCGIKLKCEVCMKAKTTRLPFPKLSIRKTQEPLDLIHTDVCGPMQTTSPSGKRYIVTFIDDFTRYTVIYLLKHKSEVTEKLIEYIEMAKTKFLRKPKVIRSDRGGEYTSNQLVNYLKSEGIQMQYTAANTPEQNGVAERKNRTLIEMARCMLLDADLSNVFWAEAVTMANYIQNRLPSRSVAVTPFEGWNGYKPHVNHFKVFGTKCYVYVPAEKRQKFDRTANEMVFVGYDEQSKAYRCYNPSSRKIVISRNVQFADNKHSSKEKVIKMTSKSEQSNNSEVDLTSAVNEKEKNEVSFEVNSNASRSVVNQIEEKEIDNNSSLESETELRRSTREYRRPPIRLIEEVNVIHTEVPPVRLTEEINIIHTDVIEPKNFKEAVECGQKENWTEAMREEMESLKRNCTWTLCDLPCDQNVIGCKWVYKIKKDADGNISRFKARLVAQGFSQKYGSDYDQVFAPVVRQTTFRILLSIAGKQNMYVQHLDAKTAFLNGELKETIYMKQPPGFVVENCEEQVCRLNKSLYGLKQAARAWNDVLHQAFIEIHFTQSKVDPCLYYKNEKDNYCFVLVYVDDLIVASKSRQMIGAMETALKSKFEMKNLGEIKHYLGIEISKDSDGNYQLCQIAYIQKIALEFGMNKAKSSNVPMDQSYGKRNNESEILLCNKKYQKLIGCLLYIAVNTRPDISASISILAQKVSQPTQTDWNELKRVLRYLKGTSNLKLTLSNNNNDLLFGYADASWADDRSDRKSNSGYIFKLNGGVVSWCCRKQTCVALSSTEAEFIALSDACQEASWIRRILIDMQLIVDKPTVIFEDNQSCLKLIEDEKLSNRTKHIDTRYHFVKDYITKNIVICKYCPSETMLADLLTKPLPTTRHKKLREECGIA